MMKKILKTSIAILAISSLAACSNFPFGGEDKFDDDMGMTGSAGGKNKYAQTQGASQHASIEDLSGAGNVDVAGKSTFYFKFDNSTVAQHDYQKIREHANYLASHPNAVLHLDGHTDERGAREYNLALGERRAKSVAELLKLQGADPNQIEVITHGQEKPIALGHNEDAWRLNRRVEMFYKTY